MMVNELLLGMMAGLKLGIFSALLAYTHLAYKTSEMKLLWLFYPVSFAFLVMAVGEAAFVLDLVTEQTVVPWVSQQDNIHVLNDFMYLVASSFAAVFMTLFYRGLED